MVWWARSGGESSLQSLFCKVKREEKERGKEAELEGLTDGAELWSLMQACTNPSLASCLSEEQRQAMEGMACAYREEEVHMRLQEAGSVEGSRHVSSGDYIMKPAVLDKKDCQCPDMLFVSQETENLRSCQ